MEVKQINPKIAKQWLDADEAVLIDVREPAEYKTVNIPGSILKPSDSICCGDIPNSGKKIIVHCQKGLRGSNACQKLVSENSNIEVYNLEGGIEAWQKAGFYVKSSGRKTLPLDRQVQIAIGLCVLIFSLFGYFINPVFSLAAAFFGAGLLNAGISGWCGLGKLMARMPWNTA